MTTKNYHLSLKNGQNMNLNSSCKNQTPQYSNFNLCQNHHLLTNDHVLAKDASLNVKLKEKCIKECYDSSSSNFNSTSLDKHKKDCPSKQFEYSNLLHDQKSLKQKCANISSRKNSSTLSLHIAAYENFLENPGYVSEAIVKESGSNKFPKGVEQQIESTVQNLFEFPRQQEDITTEPQVMQFKVSQQLFSPNQGASSSQTRNDKCESNQKTLPLFTCKMTSFEYLYHSLMDSLYYITFHPKSVKQLAISYSESGQQQSLQCAIRILGFSTFEDFVRQNIKALEKFLQFYVTMNETRNVGQMAEFTLYFFNKKSKQNGTFSNLSIEATTIDQRKLNSVRVNINSDELKFFEFHNNLQFLDGRKHFAKAVEICKNENMINANGFVVLHDLAQKMVNIYGTSFSSLLKLWFPNIAGMRNIMNKILFDEVYCRIGNPDVKREHAFRLHKKFSIDEICEYLDSLKNDAQVFFDKVSKELSMKEKAEKNRKERKINFIPSAPIFITSKEPNVGSIFVDSEDESDYRVENKPYYEDTDVEDVGLIAVAPQSEHIQEQPIQGCILFADKYLFAEDVEMENLLQNLQNYEFIEDVPM